MIQISFVEVPLLLRPPRAAGRATGLCSYLGGQDNRSISGLSTSETTRHKAILLQEARIVYSVPRSLHAAANPL